MVSVTAVFSQGALRSLSITGHAAPKGKPGYEVCVATSVLAQGMVKAVKRMFTDKAFTYTKAKGDLTFTRTHIHQEDEGAYAFVTTGFLIALEELAREHPTYIEYSTNEE